MQTNYDTPVHPDDKTDPFYIPEITDHLFQFLKLHDIKSCRLVCLKWNQLAEKFLQKLSVVNMSTSQHLEKFNQAFPNPQESKIFTSFLFERFYHFESPVYNLVAFFEKWHYNLSEIALIRMDFGLEKTYDLSPFLPSTLTKLSIKVGCCNSKVIISIDKICNTGIIELNGCILNNIPGTILNPVEIELEKVTFVEGEKNIEEFLINPLLNFDVLKKASFSGENIMLDLQGSNSLHTLRLQNGVRVLSWETSNWEIKKLILGVYTCKEKKEDLSKSQIKYKELEIWLPHLNVSLLQEGIEKLQAYLHDNQEAPPRISGKHNFPVPDFKQLHFTLEEGNEFSPFVEFFQHCPNLTILTVELLTPWYEEGVKSILKISALPLSVKTLRVVSGVRIILDRSFQLESFIIYDPDCGEQKNNIVGIAKELQVKNLIWFGPDVLICSDGRRVFDNDKGKIVKSLIDLNLDNFAVIDRSQGIKSELEKTYVFPLFETPGKYYLLQRGKDKIFNMCQNAEENNY